MPEQSSQFLYRPCAGIMLVNHDGLVFVGRRIDNPTGNWWQMPQGGIDQGETPEQAALRELREETGVPETLVNIIASTRDPVTYDLPPELQGKLWGGKYRGQRQSWFLARFFGKDTDINLNAFDPPEFLDWKWVAPVVLPELIIPFKKEIYRSIVDEFSVLI